MGAGQRRKGGRGEGEVLKLIQARWPRATRNFASGAAGNSDFAYGPANVVIEAKRTERLRLREAWRQVCRDAQRAGPGVLPVLATRWNGTPHEPAEWLAVLPLDELLALLELREKAV